MQPRKLVATALLGFAIVCSGAATATVSNPQFNIVPVDAAWRAGLPRDPTAATQAYLDRLPPQVVARANASTRFRIHDAMRWREARVTP
jgi:hypothetical protein